MITAPKNISVQSFGVQDSVSFGIKEDGLAHVFGILRNQLYSDKILAVIREYSCNAVDANVENGNEKRPIRVTLPNMLDKTFKVRDFGRGLTDGDIHEIYAFYGESTKRSSNKFIGQLGLGSKAAFAYGDNFVINSFVDGKKTTYNAFIDATQIGKISKLAVEKTSEENGVEIIVSVNTGDINSFVTKTKEFFSYFKIKPVFEGATILFEDATCDSACVRLSGLGVPFCGDSWKLTSNKPVAVMGNVGYRINYSSVVRDNLSAEEHLFFNYIRGEEGIDLLFEIGDLEVAANREELQYTKKTIDAIFEKGAKFATEFKEGLIKCLYAQETLVQAKKFYGASNHLSWGLRKFVADAMSVSKYKGQIIDTSAISFNGVDLEKDEVSIHRYSFHRKNNCADRRGAGQSNIDCVDILVVNDLGNKNHLGLRLRHFSKGKRVYVFNYADEQKLNNFLKREKIEKSDVIMASTLPLPEGVGSQARGTRFATTRVRKATSTVCAFSGLGQRPQLWRSRYCYWDAAEIDWLRPAVYVNIINGSPICSFQSDSGLSFDIRANQDLNSFLQAAKEAGCDIPILYGIKKEKMPKALKSPALVTFTKFVKDFLESPKNKEKVQLYIDYIKIKRGFPFIDNHTIKSDTIVDKDSILLKLLEVIKTAKASEKINKGLFELVCKLTAQNDANASKECLGLMTRVDEAYPLLAMLHSVHGYCHVQTATIHYINGMDLARSQVVGS